MRPDGSRATGTRSWEGKDDLGAEGGGKTLLWPCTWCVHGVLNTQTLLTENHLVLLEALSSPPLPSKNRLQEENESSFTSFPIYPGLQIYQWGSF